MGTSLLVIYMHFTNYQSCSALQRQSALPMVCFRLPSLGQPTEDIIADLEVRLWTGHLLLGVPYHGERFASHNRLIDIEDELARKGVGISYAGEQLHFAYKEPNERLLL